MTLRSRIVTPLLLGPIPSCIVMATIAGQTGSMVTELALAPALGIPTPEELTLDLAVNFTAAAVSCFIFPPAQVANVSFGIVAVTMEATLTRAAAHASVGATTAILTGEHVTAFATRQGNGGGSSGSARESTPTTNPSEFRPVKGSPAKQHKTTGEIFVKDRLHKDHYEVYKNKKMWEKGKRTRSVWTDGRPKETF